MPSNLAVHGDAFADTGSRDAIQRAMREIEARLVALEAKTPVPTGFVDQPSNPLPTTAGIPQTPGLTVGFSGGIWTVQVASQDQFSAPIQHNVEWSLDPTFATGVTSLGVGPQHFFTVSAPANAFWRVTSTFDGFNFSDPSPSTT